MAAHFLQALGFASMPLLPVYLTHLGAGPGWIGVVMGEAAVGGLLARPLVGWSLDAIGRRRTLVAGTLLVGASLVGLAGVVAVGPLIHALRVAFGVGVGALFTGYFTFAADVVPEARRTEGLALFGVSGLAPLAVNPFVARLGLEPEQLRWVFPAVGALVLLSMVPMWGLSARGDRAARDRDAAADGGIGVYHPRRAAQALLAPRLRPVIVATTVFAVPLTGVLSFATVAAAERGLSDPTSFWLTFVAGAGAVRLFGARLPDLLGVRNMVAPSLLCYGGSLLVLALGQGGAALLLAGLLGGLGHGYGFPVLVSQVVSRSPTRLRGTAMAMFTGLFDATALVANPLYGLIAGRLDYPTAFTAGAVAVAAGLAVWLAMEHRLGGHDGANRGEIGSQSP